MLLTAAAAAGSAATLGVVAAASAIAGRRRGKREARSAQARLGPLASPRQPYAEEVLVAAQLALECGEAMRQCLQKKEVTWKDSAAIDPVTATDQENERRVERGLQAHFPEHLLIGEEASAAAGKRPPLTEAPTWVVDPIDGTTNFVYGIKLSAVSLGLCVGKEPTVGVIYDPYADELFTAVRGRGAYLNGQRIAVDGVQRLPEAMVLFEMGYVRTEEGMGRILGALKALLLRAEGGARASRFLGSCVLSMAWVACGRSSVYFTGVSTEGGHPWDYAAGTVVAREAGAEITNLQGGPFSIEGSSCICAASPSLATELRATMAEAAALASSSC